jgi:hypothetical protein
MRYTPRQDGIQYGVVKDHEFYVSDSMSDWGTAVEAGAFGAGTQSTTVTFSAKAGRHVRFRALSEISGKPYTSVAEINVGGTPL